MDLRFSDEERAFQMEVRAFLEEAVTDEFRRAKRLTPTVFMEHDIVMRWQKILYEKGWLAPSWPEEHGGCGWTAAQKYLFELECARADAPMVVPLGLRMCGPVILKYGTPEQKAHYLPRMLSGEDYWCQGYSEPGSGSDLASLKTKAVRDGDHYVVNGTKIWTTHAHFANKIFCLVRTSDEGKRQAGITFLLMDMKTPGISVRPIITIGGDHEVNQVFFDDVRVPVANRVGEEGQGWEIAKYLLEFERGSVMVSGRLRGKLRHLRDMTGSAETGAYPFLEDEGLLSRMNSIEIDVLALEMMEMRMLSKLASGESPGAESSILKTRASQLTQAVSEIEVDMLGLGALPWHPTRPLYEANEPPVGSLDDAVVMPHYLNARASTIYGGSNEVQKEIIAKITIK